MKRSFWKRLFGGSPVSEPEVVKLTLDDLVHRDLTTIIDRVYVGDYGFDSRDKIIEFVYKQLGTMLTKADITESTTDSVFPDSKPSKHKKLQVLR